MIKVGVTGGIGSGKTYVCDILKRYGVPVYSCDDEAKRIMTEDDSVRRALCKLVGDDAYSEDSAISKAVMARFLFSNEENAMAVNGIVHPAVKTDFLRWAERQDSAVVAQESALLFEAGFDDTVDLTVEVYAPFDVRLARAMRRDSATEQQVRARMMRQMDEETKRDRADFCIVNDGVRNVEEQVAFLINDKLKTHNL